MDSFGKFGRQLDNLFLQAGLDSSGGRENPFGVLTMDSQRLAWHAAEKSPEMGEAMWRATSRRYFEGKDTEISPQDRRLDNHELLLECAAEAGMNLEDAQQVLADPSIHRQDVLKNVSAMHRVGIHAIPVLIFEVDGICNGSWLQDPRASWPDEDDPDQIMIRVKAGTQFPGREIHHGSGNKAVFKEIFLRLHQVSLSRGKM
mmetsp:Transcript_86639/g.158789  ORF Transcript_86639/g.158789 Transcript_86639/m.158789 type:complete len:202 (+) Transcript_86639:207-812(+)